MTQNIIYLSSLQGEYKTGLIFSIIDGLMSGHSLVLIDEQKPTDFEALLKEVGIKNIKWSLQQKNSSQWELEVIKDFNLNSEHVGCCGMCGGHSK